MLRATEKLRVEHEQKLRREEEHIEAWIKDLKTSHAAEKAYLLTKISDLEKVSKPCERESVESDSCESENASECLPDVSCTAASDPWQPSHGEMMTIYCMVDLSHSVQTLHRR